MTPDETYRRFEELAMGGESNVKWRQQFRFGKTLRDSFAKLGLPADAIEWLMGIWEAIQAFDDIADGDPVSRPMELPWALVGLPANAFFQRNQQWLLPVMAGCYLKWRAADAVERKNQPTAMSYAWRAGYYDLVLQALLITHGQKAAAELAETVMGLYGEKFEDYLGEFKCPIQP